MLKERLGAARKVEAKINGAEAAGACAGDEIASLVSEIFAAQRAMRVSPILGREAVLHGTEAQRCVAEALEHLAKAHMALVRNAREVGLGAWAFGDDSGCSTFAPFTQGSLDDDGSNKAVPSPLRVVS